MVRTDLVRRPGYGSSSSLVGERGARTRQQIIEVTLELFATQSFHDTLVEDIARAAGISRATLYQYFESKEQIFLELVEESGGALLRVMRGIGPLGPDADGLASLRWWLGEWSSVYERYATIFIQWANVDSPRAPLRPMIAGWLDAYTTRMVARLDGTTLQGIESEAAALALWAIVERFNYRRNMGVAALSGDAGLDDLAVVLQLMLFPETPRTALPTCRPAPATTSASVRNGARPHPGRAGGPRSRPPLAPEIEGPSRDAGLSPRARRTYQQLVEAGGRLFATQSYHGTSVDQIVADAGVARGTFYKYFHDKLDLLVTLGHECCADAEALSRRFAGMATDDRRHDQLQAWVGDFVAMHTVHAGVLRAWLEGVPAEPCLERAGRRAVRAALAHMEEALGRVPRSYPLDVRAAALLLLGLLDRFPDQGLGTRFEQPADRIVETLALVIERGFLNPGGPPASPVRTASPR